MVFESILNPKKAEKRLFDLFIITIIYTFLCILLSAQFFGPSYSSVLTIALITIVFVPFFQRLFILEEKKDEKAIRMKKYNNFLARHARSLYVFSVFFLGIITTMSIVAVFMPSYSHVFELQHKTLSGMSGAISGYAIEPNEKFITYFLNNSQVLILVFLLSLAFGAGSIFILTWNASVIAVYTSYFVQSFILKGYETTIAFAKGVPIGLGSIALHGIPEISAYFVGGLAGGILSVGVIREKTINKEFKLVIKDSLYLLVLAELLILLAAFLEAFL